MPKNLPDLLPESCAHNASARPLMRGQAMFKNFVDAAASGKSYPQAFMQALDLRRMAMGVSRRQWAIAAQITERQIVFVLRGERGASDALLARAKRALDRLDGARGVAEGLVAHAVAQRVYHQMLALSAYTLQVPIELVRALAPADAPRGVVADDATRQAHKARALAVYLCHVQIGIKQRALVQVLKIDKAAVSRIISRMEDMRDDPAFDGLLARMAQLAEALEGARDGG